MTDRTCRWCDYLASLYGRKLEQEVRQYIDRLDPSDRTDDESYSNRLEKCMGCVKCHSGICMYCGCIVAARAAKKKMACPLPDEPLWDSI